MKTLIIFVVVEDTFSNMNSIKGGAISLLGVSIQQLISLGGMIYLARILTPQDFGIYAICFAVFLFFQSFLDFGLTPLYLKYPEVNVTINSSFLSINLFFGVVVAVILLALSPLVVGYYKIDLLYTIFFIQAGVALTMSLSNQPFSQLIRQKRFIHTESITISSNLFALIVAILLALKGFGPIALAAKHLTYGLTRFIGSIVLSKAKYTWISLTKILEIKSYIVQAYHLTVSRLITGISGNIDKLIIAKIFGETILGHYERALFVVEKPNTFRNALTTPAMSYIAQMEKQNLSEAYSILSHLILFFIGLPCLFFFSYGSDLTLLILGPQWGFASEYVSYLAFLGFALILKGLVNIIHINELETKRLLNIYWLYILWIYPPLLYSIFALDGKMTTFVIIYSFGSLLYWLVLWVYTMIKFTTQSTWLNPVTYILVLVPLFLCLLSLIKEHFSSIDFNLYLEMVLSLITSLILTSIIMWCLFNHQIKNQYNFIRSRIG